ncbi:MAG: hypothetical protein IJW88_03570 [Alistipes sp.]|nr:hypothetical protein [Alistipes sp.]
MKRLITPEQVVSLAFSDAEYISVATISDSDIDAATNRYILPIVGQSLVDALLEQNYSALLEQYVAPALAFAVRHSIQPTLNLRTADSGLLAPRTDNYTTPSQRAVITYRSSIKNRMRELLCRLSDHLNSAEYEEYNPKQNILNRCSIDGGFVQIF